MHMDIERNAGKAAANFKKHGVRFEEAATSLLDPLALVQEDDTSEGEARWVLRYERERAVADRHLHTAG